MCKDCGCTSCKSNMSGKSGSLLDWQKGYSYAEGDPEDPELYITEEMQEELDKDKKKNFWGGLKDWFDDGTVDKAASTGFDLVGFFTGNKKPRSSGSGGTEEDESGSGNWLVIGAVVLVVVVVGTFIYFKMKK